MSKHQMDPQEVRLFCGQSHPTLARGIANHLGIPLEKTLSHHFSNDCMEVQLGASVRSRSVFIVQSLIKPVSENLMELLMMVDIARSAGAHAVHAIIPYYSYARSDKKDAPRISITARLVADLLVTAGATHIMTMTLHAPQVHGFFSVPADILTARPEFAKIFSERDLKKTVVVAPDVGHAKSAARFSRMLNLPVVAADKERISDTEVRISGFFGHQVRKYRQALVYDDEISTGGSVIEVCKVLARNGVERIIPICTHGVFSGKAFERLATIPQIVELVTTDTVPQRPEKAPVPMTILPVAPLFGEALWLNYSRQSIGGLFTDWQEIKS